MYAKKIGYILFCAVLLAGTLFAATYVFLGYGADAEVIELPVLDHAISLPLSENFEPHPSDPHLAPRLNALPAHTFHLEDRGGSIHLLFSVTYWNDGHGPLELVSEDTDEISRRDVYQRVYLSRSQGGEEYVDHYVGAFYWNDPHIHYHFEGFALYTLQPVDETHEVDALREKITYCVRDTDRIDPDHEGSPDERTYYECGMDFQGVSVGWGDTYDYSYWGQDFEITALPPGEYVLTVRIDPDERFMEIDRDTNTSSVRLFLDPAAGAFEVLDDGGLAAFRELYPEATLEGIGY